MRFSKRILNFLIIDTRFITLRIYEEYILHAKGYFVKKKKYPLIKETQE